jgi:hypothetical protein
VSCILVPGSGEPNFDSSEADPFEGSKARREREIKSLLDKVQFNSTRSPCRGTSYGDILISEVDSTRYDHD